MNIATRLLTFSFALILSACSLQTAAPEKTNFTLGAHRSETSPVRAEKFGTLNIAIFRAAQANHSANLLYRESEQRIVADPYRALLAPPAILITERSRQWLAESGLFRSVLASDSRIKADLTLEGEISELYADVRDPKNPTAVLALRAWLLDSSGKAVRPEWRFQRRIALNKADAASVVAAYDLALNMALRDLENTLSQ